MHHAHDEDKNAINDKYIVSVTKLLADYFLCFYNTMVPFFGMLKPSLEIKPVRFFFFIYSVIYSMLNNS